MITSIITARGGSTRTINKNGRLFCGVPLLAWSIIQSKTAKLVGETYLTTDSEEYARIGEYYGAKIIMRPVWDNGVTAGVAFAHAIHAIEAEQENKLDDVLTMLPTSPLKKPGQMDELIEAYRKAKVDTITTAAPVKETYVFKNCKGSYWDRFQEHSLGEHYQAKMVIGDKFWKYSRMCGGWGISKRDYYLHTAENQPELDIVIDTAPINKKLKWDFFPVEDWQLFEIDYPEDFSLCEAIMEHMILKGKNAKVYGKDVPLWEEEKINMLLGKYAGNSNQQ